MRLRELAGGMRDVEIAGGGDPEILFLTSDSRETKPGALFAALPGSRENGAAYTAEAIRKGAAALLLPDIPRTDPGVPYMLSADTRKSIGEAADVFYERPSRSLCLVGITGTNGKTTTAYLLRHIFNFAGRRCGMLGTVEYDLGGKLEPAPLTTPDAIRFTRSLAEMRDSGCQAAAVEVSSHALDQDRVWPHRFACGIFTNLTREHLDYHVDMERYLEAKRILFARLDEQAMAVFNRGDSASGRLAEGCAAKKIYYLLRDSVRAADNARSDLFQAEIIESGLEGQVFRIDDHGLERKFPIPLIGRHNIENCLGAILAARGLGIGLAIIMEALERFPGVPGRLERIESRSGATVFVDYAHTGAALRSVLSVLRPLAKERLITVFGCGGDRDKGKRPAMARAAEEFSDLVIVTSDNPRTEDPEVIIADIMKGFADPTKVMVNADRAGAIRLAAEMVQADDVLLVAGKGHENYQIIGTDKRYLDDRELVREAFG
ncbi:MAG: UDP-N-acetylmuramoyl-L-alanyl-D-glutamate--2,6-diaminopimelate ligase [Planctomycetes bacterium]|nr:UDP-N-acetylmuramoyl-L-alanyl-D-glutamate--2,6-diaminopimelate ligase [Planctomycetota bacterium]